MSIQKLKIATYCMMKKAQGYKLLKNPKGTPATTVKVLKYSDSINPKTLDISKSYETITKDFSKYNSPETTTNLDIEKYAFFNKKTKGFNIKKQVDYAKYRSDYHYSPISVATKGLVPTNELKNRDLKDLNTVVACRGFRNSRGRYIIQESTRADLVLKAYNDMKSSNEEKNAKNSLGFFKTLWANLKQG